jgi:hypothetical protein
VTAVQRLVDIAGRFGIGYFITLGVLTITNRFLNAPATIEAASIIAVLGGLVGAASSLRR